MASTKHEYWNTGDTDNSDTIRGTQWRGQTFTVGTNGTNEDHDITSVKVKMFKEGSPGTLIADIKLVTAGEVVGDVLSTGTINTNNFTTNEAGAWYEISMSSYTLESSREYALILHLPDGDLWNNVDWIFDHTTPSYTGGTIIRSGDSGETWDIDPWTGADFLFEIWGEGGVSPPVAAFSATKTLGIEPFKTTFIDESTNTPTSWLWDFGDAKTSIEQNPTHEYTSAGDYTVTLTATNAIGNDTEVKTNYIKVIDSKKGGATATHDFKKNPELTNAQMDTLYFDSPHRQIVSDFEAEVIRVHDGDTITVRVPWRDFDFPIRMARIDARELNEGGKDSGEWLRSRIEGKMVTIGVNFDNRVGKFGRLIGEVIWRGINMNDDSIRSGQATPFGRRREGLLPIIDKELGLKQWF